MANIDLNKKEQPPTQTTMANQKPPAKTEGIIERNITPKFEKEDANEEEANEEEGANEEEEIDMNIVFQSDPVKTTSAPKPSTHAKKAKNDELTEIFEEDFNMEEDNEEEDAIQQIEPSSNKMFNTDTKPLSPNVIIGKNDSKNLIEHTTEESIDFNSFENEEEEDFLEGEIDPLLMHNQKHQNKAILLLILHSMN